MTREGKRTYRRENTLELTMKALFSGIRSRMKTKRRRPAAPCDCCDFFSAVPVAPSVDHLRRVVHDRQFDSKREGREFVSKDVLERREHTVRSITFDLQYRCGGAGRCTCEGAPACRFPTCFSMRPVIKGAEIQAERYAFEVDEAPTPEIRAVVALAQEQRLDEAVVGIKQLVERQLKAAAGARPLDRVFRVEEGASAEGFVPRSDESSGEIGVNPLRTNEELCEEVTSLYLWRAALLVNLRRDDEAVHSLLNLARALEQKQRTRLYGTAAGWACLNDMEVVYYRSVLTQYRRYPEAERFAHGRPMLLPRVFEAIKGDDYHTEYCTHVVFSKEVTATVSRAQAAQMYGDASEDPMLSLCIPLSMPYYRFCVGDDFWERFLTLLCMPPAPPPGKDDVDPAADLALTPTHVLDAVGRSMLLHHLILFADAREKDIAGGAVAKRVRRMRELGEEPQLSDYGHVLTEREMSVAVARMKQLLVVVKTHEDGEKKAAGPAAAGSGQT